MTRARHRDAGFTLIELLVALGVLAMLSGLLLAGLGVTRGTWRGLDRRLAGIDEIEAAQRIIRQSVTQLVPITRFDATRPYSDVGGDARALFWLAPPPPTTRPAPLAVYRLSQSTGSELVLSLADDLSPATIDPPREDRVLLRNVASVEVAYFGAAQPDYLRRWREEWRDNPRPPELIRLRVTLAAGDRRRWPELLLRPAATIDTACILNIASGACKGR